MTMRLDVSIGPVQGFVAQSRRTRDLWGSSYLLAFLSAHAMRGADAAGAPISQPVVGDDPLYRWVCGHRDGAAPPVGSLPNHFVVSVDGDPAAVANAAIEAFQDAWRQVCNAVWKQFVEPASDIGNGTKQIWNRQVDNFWEITWTAGELNAEGGLLARRKHWRSHCPPGEPGDKCAVMHDLQELSGHVRSESSASRREQDRFWHRVRASQSLGLLDLRHHERLHERLCAIALVKRLFPRVAREALGWNVETSHWPSTVYVGAVPWITRVINAVPRQARAYADTVRRNATGVFHEQQPPFAGLKNVPEAGDFTKLDANYFHLNENVAAGAREQLGRALKDLYDAKDAAGQPLGAPASFYALLLADGDRLGRLVGEAGGEDVSRALATFTGEVRKVVCRHDGSPSMQAATTCWRCSPSRRRCHARNRWRSATGRRSRTEPVRRCRPPVTFAHVRLPLAGVIAEAHRLLDDVAKDGNGRDSLAAARVETEWLVLRMDNHVASSPAE